MLNAVSENFDLWGSAHTTKSASGRGSSSKLDLHGIKKLRELILELAVRGKLVPQNSNDEPASVLLERIAAEKAQLLKTKKIKKQKPVPPITDKEKPFVLPEGWVWVRFGDVTFNRDAERVPLSVSQRRSRQGKYDYYGASGVIDSIDGYLFDKPLLLIGEDGANLINRSTPIAFMAYGKYWVNNHAHVLDGITEEFLIYLGLFINAISLESYVTGTAQPKMNQAKMNTILFAFPPEAEFIRITAKVNELMTLCDQLEQQQTNSITAHQTLVEELLATLTNSTTADEVAENWARIAENFDTLFTTDHSVDQLKQTVLQLAVMGRLVPQNPEDEPASVLLEKIAAEKAQLVKDKKIKKQKPLPVITDEEKPFNLPAGWVFAQLEDIVDIQSGITKGRKLAGRNLISVPYLRVANVQRSALDLTVIKEVEIPIEEKEKYEVIPRDLLITEGGDWDKVGRTSVWSGELPYVAHQNHVFKARIFLKEQSEDWIEMYLNAPFARAYFAGSSKQTTNLASINKTQLRGCLVAIPPAKEKSRIVSKVNELMGFCNTLKSQIHQTQTTQLQLANAMVEQAVA
ncbi:MULTISPECIES: restriction endonuclease subunit S [unclassified Endozoicomonas]